MTGKVSVVIEQDEHGCYAWCPELKGCQSEGKTIEESLANIREAIELFLETLTDEARSAAVAEALLLKSGFAWMRSKGSHRIYAKGGRRVVVPFHGSTTLHPKTVKQ